MGDVVDELLGLCSTGQWGEVLARTRSLAIDDFKASEAASILFFEGLSLYHMERLEEARQAVSIGLEFDRLKPGLLDLAARIAAADGRNAEAAMYHERALSHCDEAVRPLFLLNYASTLAASETWAPALMLVLRAEADGAGCPESALLAARCLRAMGRLDEALDRYDSAIETRMGDIPARIEHANCLAATGDLEGAEEAFRDLLDLGFDGEVLYNWAVVRLTAGNPTGCIGLLRLIPAEDRYAPAGACLHAKALAKMGATEAALGIISSSLDLVAIDPWLLSTYDDFVATEARENSRLRGPAHARRRLVARISRVRRDLPISLQELSRLTPPESGELGVYEVTCLCGSGGWTERLVVAATSQSDAGRLAAEIHFPDDVASAAISIRPVVGESPKRRGVISRRFEAQAGRAGATG